MGLRSPLPKPSELRDAVRRALKAARVRPTPKNCANAARVVMQDEVTLEYVEGRGGMPPMCKYRGLWTPPDDVLAQLPAGWRGIG
jgi:hypothetical protein